MNIEDKIWEKLESVNFKVSTDTRKDLTGSIYFALKGENFDGNKFVHDALKNGAEVAVTEDKENVGENIYFVVNVLETLNILANKYRKQFNCPIVVIGGSNGKTTSKDLLRDVLQTKYRVHATVGSLNNHFGVPLSILSMSKDTEIGLFEIGANHPHEHTLLLNIIFPTHVVVTNNGMDHLEGFKNPEGVRLANKEIYDWAKNNNAIVFVNKKSEDLIHDSEGCTREIYSKNITPNNKAFLSFEIYGKEYETNLVGEYNLENIELALSIGEYFKIPLESALKAACDYIPVSKRSQLLSKNNISYIVDCYNANPSSMKLSIESFIKTTTNPRGLILGDMLELGEYSKIEHEKIVRLVDSLNIDCAVYVGNNFKEALGDKTESSLWFSDSDSAREWFNKQSFSGYSFLLKGSRGVKVEKIIE